MLSMITILLIVLGLLGAFDANAQTEANQIHGNGANCSSGDAPLGVDELGAVEGCFTPGGGDPETNTLTTLTTGITTGQVPIGTTAGEAVAYVTFPPCAADEKPEYVDGAPDTIVCEAIGSLVDADISNTLTASIFGGTGGTTANVDLDTAEVAGLLNTTKGGTGVANPIIGSLLLGNGANPVQQFLIFTEGSLLVGDGAMPPTQAVMSGDATFASTGVLTIAASHTTHAACIYIEDPVTDEDLTSVWRAPVALTITEIWCETDAGTAGLELTNDDGTPTGVNGSDISCAVSAGTSDASFAGDASLAQNDRIDVNVGTVATAARLSVCWRYTVD